MADAFMKVGESETKFSPMQNNGHLKDLLERFLPQETTQLSTDQEKKVHEKPVDINLGLSLGGIYTSQKTQNSYEKPLLSRSSSIIGTLTLKKDPGEFGSPLPKSFLSLARSCSVPTEAEQEQRKATFMALAMRKIESTEGFITRQRNQNVAVTEREKSPITEPMPTSPSKVAAWAAASAARSPALCRALVQIQRQTSLSATRKLEGQEDSAAEKGAIRSQSLPTENNIESKVMLRTSASGKSVKFGETKLENPSKKAKLLNNCFQDNGMDVMKQMPSVTTTGEGPNGKKIEGFLYKYRKGQVSIVCVCHGSFLSPAEFVRHAGGNEVANPMKHITVCSSFSF